MSKLPADYLPIGGDELFGNVGKLTPTLKVVWETPHEFQYLFSKTPDEETIAIRKELDKLVRQRYGAAAKAALWTLRQGRRAGMIEIVVRNLTLKDGIQMRYSSQQGIEHVQLMIPAKATEELITEVMVGGEDGLCMLVVYDTSRIAAIPMKGIPKSLKPIYKNRVKAAFSGYFDSGQVPIGKYTATYSRLHVANNGALVTDYFMRAFTTEQLFSPTTYAGKGWYYIHGTGSQIYTIKEKYGVSGNGHVQAVAVNLPGQPAVISAKGKYIYQIFNPAASIADNGVIPDSQQADYNAAINSGKIGLAFRSDENGFTVLGGVPTPTEVENINVTTPTTLQVTSLNVSGYADLTYDVSYSFSQAVIQSPPSYIYTLSGAPPATDDWSYDQGVPTFHRWWSGPDYQTSTIDPVDQTYIWVHHSTTKERNSFLHTYTTPWGSARWGWELNLQFVPYDLPEPTMKFALLTIIQKEKSGAESSNDKLETIVGLGALYPMYADISKPMLTAGSSECGINPVFYPSGTADGYKSSDYPALTCDWLYLTVSVEATAEFPWGGTLQSQNPIEITSEPLSGQLRAQPHAYNGRPYRSLNDTRVETPYEIVDAIFPFLELWNGKHVLQGYQRPDDTYGIYLDGKDIAPALMAAIGASVLHTIWFDVKLKDIKKLK